MKAFSYGKTASEHVISSAITKFAGMASGNGNSNEITHVQQKSSANPNQRSALRNSAQLETFFLFGSPQLRNSSLTVHNYRKRRSPWHARENILKTFRQRQYYYAPASTLSR